MTDKKRILKFAKDMGFKVVVYTDPKYICEQARAAGAVESINFHYGQSPLADMSKVFVDLNFEIDAQGRCVAFSTSHRGSFQERKPA